MDIAPRDEGIDTNHVVITGSGELESLGPGREGLEFTIHVRFEPEPLIILRNSFELSLLIGQDRVITQSAFGDYKFIGGRWHEMSFSGTGEGSLERRHTRLEQHVERLEERLLALELELRKHGTARAGSHPEEARQDPAAEEGQAGLGQAGPEAS